MTGIPPPGRRTANEELLDAMLRHQIGLLRYAGGVRGEIWNLLDATEADLKRSINRRLRRTDGPLTVADMRRMKLLLEDLRETRAAAWDDVDDVWFARMRELAMAEPKFVAAIIRTVVPVRLDVILPTAEQLRSIATTHPFDGKPLGEWAKDARRADIARIEQQIRIGMVRNEPLQSISRRIVGSIDLGGRNGATQITRNGAEAITRTAVNSIANEVRRQFAVENSDIVRRELFVATLDGRTTPICRSLDGQIFPVGEGPYPALHFSCRSMRVVIVDAEAIGTRPMKPVTERMLVEEFADRRRLGEIRRRQDLPHGTRTAFDEYARKRVRELTGIVPAKTTYDDFLRRASEPFQRSVLGPARLRLYRAGGVTLDRFVDQQSGRLITLSDLARTEADAFRAAGLDPEDFL